MSMMWRPFQAAIIASGAGGSAKTGASGREMENVMEEDFIE